MLQRTTQIVDYEHMYPTQDLQAFKELQIMKKLRELNSKALLLRDC